MKKMNLVEKVRYLKDSSLKIETYNEIPVFVIPKPDYTYWGGKAPTKPVSPPSPPPNPSFCWNMFN
jgi:hypothetical protein